MFVMNFQILVHLDLFHSLSCLLLPNLFKMPVFILWSRKCDSGEDVVNRPITVLASCVPLAWLCRIVTKFGRRTQARKRACVAAQGALACLASLRVCVKSEYKSHLTLTLTLKNKSVFDLNRSISLYVVRVIAPPPAKRKHLFLSVTSMVPVTTPEPARLKGNRKACSVFSSDAFLSLVII